MGAGTGPEQKKKHHPGCFFCAPAPGKGRGRRSFVGRRHGARAKKKHHPGCFFFLLRCGPARTLTHSLRAWVVLPLAGVVFFFLLRPRPDGVVFFFAVAPPRRSLTHFGLGRFRQGRMVFFFFCCGPAGSFLVSLKRPGGAAATKKTPRGGVFFFAAAPRGRSLTHCGPGWCLPLAGVVFFFFAAAPPGRGGVFFFLWPRPDAHSLTVGWGDFGKAGWCFFFCCGPARSFLVSPKRPGGAAAKKKTPRGGVFFFCCGPARTLTHSLRAWVVPSPRRGGVFFFAAAPPGPGWCFVFLLWPRPDAHSLTVGWGDFGKVRVVFFFLLWPRPVFFG